MHSRGRNHIDRINTQCYILTSSSQEIAKVFRDYYASLYQIDGQSSLSTSERWEAAGGVHIGVGNAQFAR